MHFPVLSSETNPLIVCGQEVGTEKFLDQTENVCLLV